MFIIKTINGANKGAVLIAAVLATSVGQAATLPLFESSDWTMIASEDTTLDRVYPGWGGQYFDAEYLFYKQEGNILHLGLQTGFDIWSGTVTYGSVPYWSGDLALSFDGNTTAGIGYEYAVDFGLLTKDYDQNLVDAGTGTGIDSQGIYSVSGWDEEIYFGQSNPFAMDNGTIINGASFNDYTADQGGSEVGTDSFYRMVSFDLLALGLTDLTNLNLDVHWTMSCGNDAIDGSASLSAVPLPASVVFMATGLFGFAGIGWLKRNATRSQL